MGNCCKGRTVSGFRGPGKVINLMAIQDASSGSVTLQWVTPMHKGDSVTGYDVRFKPVEAAHYKYPSPIDDPRQVRTILHLSDGLPPLTHCNFEVRAKIHGTSGQWSGVVQFVEWACRLPGCFASRLRISRMHISAFCSRDHAKQCAMEYCLFRECLTPKSKQQGPQYHFCNPFHLRMAKLRNLSALLEINGTNSKFKDLCKLFSKRWTTKGSSPVIKSILEVVNPLVEERFTAYTDSLPRKHRKIEQYFHGTTLLCNILEHLVICSDYSHMMEQCGTCTIVGNGFVTAVNQRQRFGPGFYLAPKSSKASDYCRSSKQAGTSHSVFLCDVVPGKKYELRTSNPGLAAPPPDHHSVYGKGKFMGETGDLNSEEIVLYTADAIRPRYLFIFHASGD